MAKITVESLGESQYRVIVLDGKQRTSHVVTAAPNDVRRYAPEETSRERCRRIRTNQTTRATGPFDRRAEDARAYGSATSPDLRPH